MAQIQLDVGGRRYALSCRDGEESHLLRLAVMIDEKCQQATQALGTMPEGRLLLTAALFLADELSEARANADEAAAAAPSGPDPETEAQVEAMARRVEALCEALERRALLS